MAFYMLKLCMLNPSVPAYDVGLYEAVTVLVVCRTYYYNYGYRVVVDSVMYGNVWANYNRIFI